MRRGDDDEDHPTPTSPRVRVRIESLSDLIFGLALSIGSIILVGRAPQNGGDIANNVLLFGFGFLIIVTAWLGYSRTMAVLPVEVPFALVANLVLLFLVAIEPYLFYVLTSAQAAGLADASSVAYALDVGGMFFMQAMLARMVVVEEKEGLHGQRPLSPALLARFNWVVKVDAVVGLIFFVSALPFFWVLPQIGYLRFYLWTSSFFIFLARRVRGAPGKES